MRLGAIGLGDGCIPDGSGGCLDFSPDFTATATAIAPRGVLDWLVMYQKEILIAAVAFAALMLVMRGRR